MHRRRTPLSIAAAAVAVAALLGPASAAAQDAPRAADVLSAVVGIRADVPPGARTAGALGTEREGSGVVIDGNGLVVTVGYLVLEASRVEIEVRGQGSVPARLVAYDHATGFGLVRATEPLAVIPMRLGSSAALERFEEVLVAASGGPGAARPAMIADRREFAGYWEYLLEDALFTTPPHPRFGGAALIDEHGRLLGIGSLVVADALRGRGRDVPGNLFLPVDMLEDVLGDLLAHGRSRAPSRPWLGVYTADVDGGLLVRHVAEDGPAARAGVEPGDIILGVHARPVHSMAEFYRTLWDGAEPGDDVLLTLVRGTEVREFEVRAGDRYEWLRLAPEG